MAIAVGVDVSLRRGLDVVALDDERRLVGTPERLLSNEDLTTFLRRVKPDVVAIDAPSDWGTTGSSRACESELRHLGVNIFSTPSDANVRDNPFYGWMQDLAGLRGYGRVGEGTSPITPLRGVLDLAR